MSRRVLLSFANVSYSDALVRLEREASQSGFFDEICMCTEKKLDQDYLQKYGTWISANKRGYGYWIWKSYLIKKYLHALNDGDYLVYLDSGCEVNQFGKKRYEEYLELASHSSLGLVCFTTMSSEGNYNKGDVLDTLGMRDNKKALCSAQIMSGVLIIYKSPFISSLVDNWYEIVHNNLHLVDDSPSVSPNLSTFIENRHDQSILSLLIKKVGGAVILRGFDEVEIWPMTNRNWRRLLHTPFHAVRRNNISSRVGNGGRGSMIMNLIWGFENYIIDKYVALRVRIGAKRKVLLQR